MRSATLAKLALTATVGIGALIGPANIASAGNGPVIKAGPSTPTTVKPIPADPAGYCDVHLCFEANPVDPDPDPPFEPEFPIAQPQGQDKCPVQVPNCDKAPPPQGDPKPDHPFDPDLPLDGPDQGCQLTHGCPGEDEPCRSDLDARTNCDGGGTGGTTGGDTTTTGGTDGSTTTGGPDGTTTGGTDGPGGRLPKTGVEVMSLVGLGAGGLGIGALLKRLGRRSKEQ